MLPDLTTLPARLSPIHTQLGPIALERLQTHHAEGLAKAGAESADSVHPWLGKSLCPITLRNAQQAIAQLEQSRQIGFGICYVLQFDGRCLGLGVVNYIHPTHRTANLGYWIHPVARGQGVAQAFCQKLQQLAFQQMNLQRLELYIEPQNKASIKLAQRLNASKEGLCKQRIFGRDAYLFSIVNSVS